MSSEQFKYAGQNIARRGNTRDYENTDDAIEYMVMDWFNEYPDANMSYIDAFRLHDEGYESDIFPFQSVMQFTNASCILLYTF